MDYKTLLGGTYTPELEKALNEAIGKEFIPKDKFDERNTLLKAAQEDLKERDKQLEELAPKAAGNEALLAEITKLQEQNKIVADEARKSYRNKLLDIKLTEQKPISLKALKAELELDKVTWDDNDNIIGLDEQIQAIKADEVRKNLFVQAPPPVTTGTGAPQTAEVTANPAPIKKVY